MFGARRKRKGLGTDDAIRADDSKKAEVLHLSPGMQRAGEEEMDGFRHSAGYCLRFKHCGVEAQDLESGRLPLNLSL